MNARDRIYTGKVNEWGLPDGTVLIQYNDKEDAWKFNTNWISPIEDELYRCYLTEFHYRIKSLPAGYKFNDAGEIVKEDKTRSAESTAIKTLESLGYKWNGGEYWRPPLGKAKSFDEETKHYWDGKEPIEVGVVGMMSGGHRKIMLPKDASGHWITQDDKGVNDVTLIEPNVNFFPVDTRTDKEKAIDDVMSENAYFDGAEQNIRDILSHTYDKWVGSDE